MPYESSPQNGISARRLVPLALLVVAGIAFLAAGGRAGNLRVSAGKTPGVRRSKYNVNRDGTFSKHPIFIVTLRYIMYLGQNL